MISRRRNSTDPIPSATGQYYIITPNHWKPLETVFKTKIKKKYLLNRVWKFSKRGRSLWETARSFSPLHSARQRLYTGLLQPEHRAPSPSPQLMHRGLFLQRAGWTCVFSSCTEASFCEGLGGPVYFSSGLQMPGAETQAQESGSEALPWAWLP